MSKYRYMKQTLLQILLPTIFFTTSINSFSQNFYAGPKGGIAFTQVDGDGYGGYHKVGVNFGAFVYRQLDKNNHWDLQFEIEYLQKGSRKTPDYEMGDYTDYKLRLNYLQIPIIARYNIRHVSLEAGGAIGILISSKEIMDEVEGGNPFKTMEYAIIFGINYHFTTKLWINGRYSVSLARIREPYNGDIPIYDPNDLWDLRRPGQYNNILVVSIYYAFNGKHKL